MAQNGKLLYALVARRTVVLAEHKYAGALQASWAATVAHAAADSICIAAFMHAATPPAMPPPLPYVSWSVFQMRTREHCTSPSVRVCSQWQDLAAWVPTICPHLLSALCYDTCNALDVQYSTRHTCSCCHLRVTFARLPGTAPRPCQPEARFVPLLLGRVLTLHAHAHTHTHKHVNALPGVLVCCTRRCSCLFVHLFSSRWCPSQLLPAITPVHSITPLQAGHLHTGAAYVPHHGAVRPHFHVHG